MSAYGKVKILMRMENNELVFNVTREKFVSVMTKIGVVLSVFGLGVLLYAIVTEPESVCFMGGFIILLIVIWLFTYLEAPKRVMLTDDAIVLYKVRGRLVLPFGGIKSIREYPSLKGVRLCGSGGLYGFIGYFYDKEIGRHLRYVGNHDEAFLIELKSGKKYVLSCENSGRVIEFVRDKLRTEA